jgi:hypothetical protein
MAIMKAQLFSTVTAAALVATIGAAAAAEAGSAMNSGNDALNLTITQQRAIYRDVTRQRMSEAVPPGFTAKVGETVPSSIKLHPLPASVTKQVSAVKSDQYAKLRNNVVLIVDPGSKKIADVISR